MAWENLPMRDRATIIKLGVQSGLRDINSIKETYNKYADGGMLPALPEYVPIEAQAGLYGGQQGQQVYRDYIQNGPKGTALVSRDTAKRIYAGMSALGYGLQFLGPVGKVVGMALQIPDIISDVDNLSKKQSVSNAASVASDMLRNTEIVKEVWPKPVGRFQLAKRPNIVKKILPFGIIDAVHDGIYSVIGKDIYDIFDSSKKETNEPKITRKKKK